MAGKKQKLNESVGNDGVHYFWLGNTLYVNTPRGCMPKVENKAGKEDKQTPHERLFALHKETTKRCFEIMEKKNQDYANNTDPYSNFSAAGTVGIHPVKGILLRISDKMARVTSFIDKGRLAVADESVDDALEDIINYCILAKGYIKEHSQ